MATTEPAAAPNTQVRRGLVESVSTDRTIPKGYVRVLVRGLSDSVGESIETTYFTTAERAPRVGSRVMLSIRNAVGPETQG